MAENQGYSEEGPSNQGKAHALNLAGACEGTLSCESVSIPEEWKFAGIDPGLDFQGEGDREQAARIVSVLLTMCHQDCSDEQIAGYDSILFELVHHIEVEVRRFVADRLSRLKRAPGNTVRHLSRDVIDVAHPILVHSPILTDDDLLEIIREGDAEKQSAICGRAELSHCVTDELVRDHTPDLLLKLAKNRGARFSDLSLGRMIQASRDRELLQIYLGARSDLADNQIVELISIATEKVRAIFLKKDRNALAERLPQAARIVAHRMSRQYWHGRFDFATAHMRVMKLARRHGIQESTLRRLAAEDKFAEVVVAFAILTRIEVHKAEDLLLHRDLEPFLLVAKASSISALSVLSVLKIGPWRHRLSEDERNEVIERFQNMRLQTVHKILGSNFFRSANLGLILDS